MKYTYRNISGVDQVLMGVGEVKADGAIHSAVPIENPNFKLEKTEQTDEEGKTGVIPVTKTKGRK